jgi:hypothetical protein
MVPIGVGQNALQTTGTTSAIAPTTHVTRPTILSVGTLARTFVITDPPACLTSVPLDRGAY